MYFKSKKTQLILLGILSLVVSRVAFLFVNDPEGPNLLIVVVLAVIIYLVLIGLRSVILRLCAK